MVADFLHSLEFRCNDQWWSVRTTRGVSPLRKTQYHCTRDLVKESKIQLEYIPMNDMLVGLLTKSLPRTQHAYLSQGTGMLYFDALTRFAARECVGDRYAAPSVGIPCPASGNIGR